MYNTSYVQALKSVSSNLKQGAKDAIGSALISANTYYAAKRIEKYVKAYVILPNHTYKKNRLTLQCTVLYMQKYFNNILLYKRLNPKGLYSLI